MINWEDTGFVDEGWDGMVGSLVFIPCVGGASFGSQLGSSVLPLRGLNRAVMESRPRVYRLQSCCCVNTASFEWVKGVDLQWGPKGARGWIG